MYSLSRAQRFRDDVRRSVQSGRRRDPSRVGSGAADQLAVSRTRSAPIAAISRATRRTCLRGRVEKQRVVLERYLKATRHSGDRGAPLAGGRRDDQHTSTPRSALTLPARPTPTRTRQERKRDAPPRGVQAATRRARFGRACRRGTWPARRPIGRGPRLRPTGDVAEATEPGRRPHQPQPSSAFLEPADSRREA